MTHTKHRKRRARATRELLMPPPDDGFWLRMLLNANEQRAMGWRDGGFAREHSGLRGLFTAPLGTPMPR